MVIITNSRSRRSHTDFGDGDKIRNSKNTECDKKVARGHSFIKNDVYALVNRARPLLGPALCLHAECHNVHEKRDSQRSKPIDYRISAFDAKERPSKSQALRI